MRPQADSCQATGTLDLLDPEQCEDRWRGYEVALADGLVILAENVFGNKRLMVMTVVVVVMNIVRSYLMVYVSCFAHNLLF